MDQEPLKLQSLQQQLLQQSLLQLKLLHPRHRQLAQPQLRQLPLESSHQLQIIRPSRPCPHPLIKLAQVLQPPLLKWPLLQ